MGACWPEMEKMVLVGWVQINHGDGMCVVLVLISHGDGMYVGWVLIGHGDGMCVVWVLISIDQSWRWSARCVGADQPCGWNLCVLGGRCSATERVRVCGVGADQAILVLGACQQQCMQTILDV